MQARFNRGRLPLLFLRRSPARGRASGRDGVEWWFSPRALSHTNTHVRVHTLGQHTHTCTCELGPGDNYWLRILPSLLTCNEQRQESTAARLLKVLTVKKEGRVSRPIDRQGRPHGLKPEYVVTWIIALQMSLKSYSRIYWLGIKLMIIIPGDFRFPVSAV